MKIKNFPRTLGVIIGLTLGIIPAIFAYLGFYGDVPVKDFYTTTIIIESVCFLVWMPISILEDIWDFRRCSLHSKPSDYFSGVQNGKRDKTQSCNLFS